MTMFLSNFVLLVIALLIVALFLEAISPLLKLILIGLAILLLLQLGTGVFFRYRDPFSMMMGPFPSRHYFHRLRRTERQVYADFRSEAQW